MLGLMVFLAMAGAPDSAAAADTQAKQNPDPSQRKICKSYANTGSRIGRTRVCATKAEWDDNMREGAIDMERFKGANTNRDPGPQPRP